MGERNIFSTNGVRVSEYAFGKNEPSFLFFLNRTSLLLLKKKKASF